MIRWTITFQTAKDGSGSNHTCVVRIYDDTYNGSPIALTPADNPLSTSFNQKDFFEPVPPDFGSFRIVDTGDSNQHIEDLHPIGASDRKVEILVDSTIKWRGYISPQAYTTEFGPTPRVLTFSLIGVLDILDAINIEDNNIGLQCVAKFLKECLEHTGFEWSYVNLSTQMNYLYDGNVDMIFYSVPELRLSLSRYNYLTNNDVDNVNDFDWTPMVGVSYLEVLKTICTFFGWTAIAEGTSFYLVSSVVDLQFTPVSLSWFAFATLAGTPYTQMTPAAYTRPTLALLGRSFAGTNHRKSIKNGFRKVTITTELNDNNDTRPVILFNGSVLGTQDTTISDIMETYRLLMKGGVSFLDPSKEKVALFAYHLNSQQSAWIPETWAVPSGTFTAKPRGDIVKGYTYVRMDTESEPEKVYTDYLRLCRTQDGIDIGVNLNFPLARITSFAGGFLPSGGALCFSAKVRSSYRYSDIEYDTKGLTQWGPFLNNLQVAIKVGDKYWNGTQWQEATTFIPVEVVAGEASWNIYNQTYGVVKDTNEGRFQNAQGFMIPVNEDLVGKVEITFYSWYNTSDNRTHNVRAIYLYDISLQYFNNDVNLNKGIRISLPTDTPFKDELSQSLSLSSGKGSRKGNSVVFWKNYPIGNLPLFFYNGLIESGYYLPEEWLAEKMANVYSKPAQWLTVEVKYDPSLALWSLFTYEGKSYVIVGVENNYSECRTKLTIASYQ